MHSPNPDASARFLAAQFPATTGVPPWPDVATVGFSQGISPGVVPEGTLPSFWKYSVFADDIEELGARLSLAGVDVTEAVQFGTIGYLSHLAEPGGNAIELIQRTFGESTPLLVESPDTLGLITLRVSDPIVSTAFYTQALGMRLLCTMAVDDGRPDPFDLYFFGYVIDDPPDADVAGVANREWLYQRRTTIIELQHYRPPTPTLATHPGAGPGLDHIGLETSDLEALVERLHGEHVEVEVGSGSVTFASPDGHQFMCVTNAP